MEQKVTVGAWQNTILDGTLRQIGGEADVAPLLPPKLTARGARVLTRGRELLQQLREMLEDPLLRADDHDPLTGLHAEIASMLDVLLRTVQAFPPSAGAQLRLCEGLEAAERLIEERLMVLHAALTHRRREVGKIDVLADFFTQLASGGAVNTQTILALASEIAVDAKANLPLRFLHACAEVPSRFVAAHSITVAQVMARLLLDDPEWKDRLEEALLAALLHDVGMVQVPTEILLHRGPLSEEQRRLVERHAQVGAHMISRIMPGGGIFTEAAGDHHERLDGTGYPGGKRDTQLAPYTRLLSVCDTYAALAVPGVSARPRYAHCADRHAAGGGPGSAGQDNRRTAPGAVVLSRRLGG